MPKRKTAPQKKDTTSNMNNAFNNDGVDLPKTTKSSIADTANKSKSIKHKTGKSSNPNFSKLTLYVKTDTVTAVKKQLLGTSQDTSELAEKLFTEWLKKKS